MYFDKYLPKSKSSDVIQNFVPDNYSSSLLSKKNVWSEKWVAVGRLETEKGFSKLVENWPDGLELDILGVGTEYRLIEKLISGKPNINLVGYVAPEHLEKRLHSYCGAIHPSLWVEVAPLTILEFHRAGLPVVYLGDNFTPAKDGIPLVGLKVDNFSSQEIFAACKTIMENRIKYSNDSRANYIEYYSPKVWLANLFRLIEKFEGVESKSNTS
jgi:glycosyltransferase involved in cell wall biosynthesis